MHDVSYVLRAFISDDATRTKSTPSAFLHFAILYCTSTFRLQSTDHELIPARNESLAAMHGSASGSNVRYYPTRKHLRLK
jgi:hypothetical protein